MRLESGRVFGLDVMRASAITLVLLSHVTLFFPSARAVMGVGLLAGYFGVELFFVLSGYLIGGILLRLLEDNGARTQLSQFWRRRWLRTLPNYFLFVLVNILLAAWLGRALPSLWPYFLFFQNLTGRPPLFFVESWSLAVEEWFYILVPVLFWAALKLWPKSFRTSSLLIICGGIVGVTVARSIYVFTTHPVWLTGVRMIMAYRLDACMFGVLAAWVQHYHPQQWERSPRFLGAFGLTILMTVGVLPFLLPGDSLFPHTIGFTVTSLGALLLLPMLDRWRSASGHVAGAVVRISLWSYSLYLVNLPVHAVLSHFFPDVSPFFRAAVFLVSSITIAGLIYRFYERPIMSLRERVNFRPVDCDLNEASPLLAKN